MATPPAASDPQALVRSRGYLKILGMAALISLPVSAAAYGFLQLVIYLQHEVFTHLPDGLGFDGAPVWWPLPVLTVAGVIVGLTIRYLPGDGGHVPANGFSAGATPPISLPGVVLAAVATLSLGAVLGPEAPLVALGSGLGALAVTLAAKDAPAQAATVVASAGAFAAIATIFGSPIIAGFFLMEAIGLGGGLLPVVLLPGLLAAGLGYLIFEGLGTWTGLGVPSLSIQGLPAFTRPNLPELGWAVVIGLVCAVASMLVRRGGLAVHARARHREPWVTPLAGLAVGATAVAFAASTHRGTMPVLFSGQSFLGPFLEHAGTWSVSALLLLLLFKGLGYAVSLGSFRGGPVFPSLFLGAAIGVLGSHLPGLPLVPAVAMGMGAMLAAQLRLPIAAVMVASLVLGTDGLATAPLTIVAVAVSYVTSAWIFPVVSPGSSSPAPPPVPSRTDRGS